MKKATQNLEDDHVHILRLTEIMEQITYDSDPDVNNLESIVDIIRNFADGLHHAKEENIFFPYLAERGFSISNGPVAVMINEHVTGRNFVQGMADNIKLYKEGNNQALKSVYRNMRGYAELLRSHISKENNILFRMADRVLSDDDNENLLTGFSHTEDRGIKASEYINKIENLAVLY
ncbi:MAG TPA: hemerythrin domain-containing protein [Bacteroidales bacterium]|nr:hemerythrin domain-containing protein [Bacteroidales bacterium]